MKAFNILSEVILDERDDLTMSELITLEKFIESNRGRNIPLITRDNLDIISPRLREYVTSILAEDLGCGKSIMELDSLSSIEIHNLLYITLFSNQNIVNLMGIVDEFVACFTRRTDRNCILSISKPSYICDTIECMVYDEIRSGLEPSENKVRSAYINARSNLLILQNALKTTLMTEMDKLKIVTLKGASIIIDEMIRSLKVD